MMKKILLILSILAILLVACQPLVVEQTQKQSKEDQDYLTIEEEGMSVVDENSMKNTTTETQETSEQDVMSEETKEVEKTQETSKDDEYLGLTGEVYMVQSVEGNLVTLNPKAEDPDGDAITYNFSEPFNSKGEWQTEIGDAGKYRITVTASDGKASVSQDILVVIQRANRAPEIKCNKDMLVKEGEIVKLQCEITDIDNDSLIIGYTGWMTSSKYQTTFEDAGTHKVTVTASDATHKTTEEVVIRVVNVNRAPIINADFPSKITVKEGTPIKIDTSKIVDPDGDEIKVSFTEPLDENGEWTPAEGEAGIYYVEATITDGAATITKQINIEVRVKNRPPVFTYLG